MKHLQHSTPARRDKRLGFAVACVVLIAVLVFAGFLSGEHAATAIVELAGLYLLQSQAGMTIRARAAPQKEGDA